jgi:hypothetical protein
VEYTVATGPAHVDEPIGVRWTPFRGGIYPSFEGELRVLEGDRSYPSILELEGHYTPPLGMLGSAFDAAVGHKIAETTAQYLLKGLARGIVARLRSDRWLKTFAQPNENRIRVVKGTCMVERIALPPANK